MLKFNKMFSLVFCLVFNKLLYSDGFFPGTTILTPEGLISIENLSKGDIICSFDMANEEIVEDEVIGIELCLTTNVITFNDDENGVEIVCSPTQDFIGINPWRSDELEWVKTKEFIKIPPPKLFSLSTKNVHCISKIRNLVLDEPKFLVKITTKINHNLIISEAGYIGHNYNFNLLINPNIVLDASNKSTITTNTTVGPISAPTTIQLPPMPELQPEFAGVYLLKKAVATLISGTQEEPKKTEEESKSSTEDKIRLEIEAKYKSELKKRDEEQKKLLAAMAEQQEMMKEFLRLSLKQEKESAKK